MRELEIVAETKTFQILEQSGGQDELWVTFNGLLARTAPLQSLILDRGASALHVLSLSDDWYQSFDLEALTALLSERQSKRRVVFGVSMGAFAALTYSGALNADVVILGAPQTLVDHDITLGVDERFRGWWEAIYRADRFTFSDASKTMSRSARVFIFADPMNTEDRWHFRRVERSNVQVFRIVYGGHETFETLRFAGALTPILHAAANGDVAAIAECIKTTHRVRRNSPSYWTALANTAFKQKRLAIADMAVTNALSLNKDFLLALFAAKKIYEAVGNIEAARAVVQKLISVFPLDISFRHDLAHLYAVRGEIAGAREAFREGLKQIPDSAYLHSEFSWFMHVTGATRAEVRFHICKAVELDPSSHIHQERLRKIRWHHSIPYRVWLTALFLGRRASGVAAAYRRT